MSTAEAAPRRLDGALYARKPIGFTLIEIMIVIVITAILVGLAHSSYRGYMIGARRAAAGVCLLERAQFMERYYTANLAYLDAPPPSACEPKIARFYTVGFAEPPAAKHYRLQAAPQGVQRADRECGTLTLDAQGVRGSTGSAGDASECW